MMRTITLWSAVAVVLTGSVDAQETRQKPASVATADVRAKDRAAIRETMASFANAFEGRDALKLAAHWTAEGEHQTARGDTIRGREALQAGFEGFFAATPEVHADLQPETLRFLSQDSAIDEGSVTIRKGFSDASITASYRALLVREEGQWRLASLSESTSNAVSMKDLAWLVGEWNSVSGAGAEIHTTYTWDANQKFIHGKFSIKEAERALSGTQVIGVDPETGAIHSWTFEANGGIGEADWIRDGDHWVLDAEGTLANGSSLIQTNILTRVNDDTFTWQSTGRLLDDTPVADLAPVKVTRVTGKTKKD